MLTEEFEVKIEIKRSNLSVRIIYKTQELTFEDISEGWLYDSEHIKHLMTPFIKMDHWHLLAEAIGYWVNDDFDESFPFSLIRNLNEYRPDILNDSLNETTFHLSIHRVIN